MGNSSSQLAARLRAMLLWEQLLFLASLDDDGLRAVHREYGLHPCECEEIPCRHDRAAMASPLPYDVQTWLLWRVYPRAYADPPLPDQPSLCLSPRSQAVVFAERRAAKRHLRHPGDLLRRRKSYEADPWEALDLECAASRLRNGAPVAGPIKRRKSA